MDSYFAFYLQGSSSYIYIQDPEKSVLELYTFVCPFHFNGYFSIFVYNPSFVWSLHVYKHIDSKDIKEGKEVLLKNDLKHYLKDHHLWINDYHWRLEYIEFSFTN